MEPQGSFSLNYLFKLKKWAQRSPALASQTNDLLLIWLLHFRASDANWDSTPRSVISGPYIVWKIGRLHT